MKKNDKILIGDVRTIVGQAEVERKDFPFKMKSWVDIELMDESHLKKEGVVRVIWRDKTNRRVTSFVPPVSVKKFTTPLVRDLTPKKLLSWGFKQIDLSKIKHNHHSAPTSVFQIEVPTTEDPIYGIMGYHFWIQVSLSPQYPIGNGNSGIVSIHSPQQECGAIPPDLYNKEEWTKEDFERANGYTVTDLEWTQPIAWGVTTEERFRELYRSLTQMELGKKYKPYKSKRRFPKDKPSGLTLDQWSAEIAKNKKK